MSITLSLNSQCLGLFGLLDTDNVINFSAEDRQLKEKIGLAWIGITENAAVAITPSITRYLSDLRVSACTGTCSSGQRLAVSMRQEQRQLDNSLAVADSSQDASEQPLRPSMVPLL